MKPIEFKNKLHGVINLQMTPFDRHGDLDENALKLGVRNLVNKCKGEDVVVLGLGSTGEFYAMNDKENLRACEIIVNEVNGVFPVLIGSSRAGTRSTIEASKAIQSIGADAVLVVHPYYAFPILEEVERHFTEVAAAIDIGVVIYNNPIATKLWLDTDAIRRLSKVDNIIGLKENTNNPMHFMSMMDGLDPNDIAVFAGLGHAMYQFMSIYGCDGYVTELTNYAPEIALSLLKAGREKDTETIRDCVKRMNMIWDFIAKIAARRTRIPSTLTPAQTPYDMPFYQSVHKAAMDLTGTPGGYVRSPMCNLEDSERKELAEVLVKMGCTLA